MLGGAARDLALSRRQQPFLNARGHSKLQSSAKRASPQTAASRSEGSCWLADLRTLGLHNISQIAGKVGSAALAAVFAASILAQPAPAVTNEQLLFLEAWRAVDRAYYDKNFNGKPWFKIREQFLKNEQLNNRQETYTAIRSLLEQLDDPFTRFLEPSRYAALKRGTAGSLTGVGLEVGFDMGAGKDSDLVVITPSADGPADKAGIQPRDAVVKIDGKATAGISLYDAGELLQGAEGSQVTLTIRSDDSGATRDVPLLRQRLTFNPVTSQLCKKVALGGEAEEGDAAAEPTGKVGYIRVATFSKQTTENVKAAIHQLQSEGANRYVLDIRNNGGGLFPAGVEVARMLLKDGDIVLIADSQGVRDSYSATNSAVEATAPLSILVNRGTASASEVLAGALKDNARGVIVGETTFGKGLIQTIVELSDGSGVAVTVARYQTPDGTDINKKGIQPDVPIPTEQMPPTNGPGFCKYISARGANVLFDGKAAAAMLADPNLKPTTAAPPTDPDAPGAGKPIDVTRYENAFQEGSSSTADLEAPAESSSVPADPAEPIKTDVEPVNSATESGESGNAPTSEPTSTDSETSPATSTPGNTGQPSE